jgi:hydrogenase maturation protein HypF
LRVALRGAVQGVGFRPFVFRLATSLGLAGWIQNSSAGLVAEVEGASPALEDFLLRLERERPPHAVVLTREVAYLAPAGFTSFEIVASDDTDEKTAALLPDLATCPACLAELFDPADRRYRYPFTNCTLCGPRYTIILDLPYDRPNTTMRDFSLCRDCAREYHDPAARRFHAQPIACPVCGPRLEGSVAEAARRLAAGQIVALKGIGGFQLLADATDPEAVRRLRERKHREAKPLALMMASIEMVRRHCRVSPAEETLLRSPAAPIVLLDARPDHGIAPNVAPGSPYLGVMLPNSPLHHLLLGEFPRPVVATSGNRSDEPIAIDNEEARRRLGGIADFFLMHDRPIARPCDDSVVRLTRGRETVLRRARGYAPLPVPVARPLPPVLAVGAHLKNTVAIAVGRQVFVSQHIGDLDTFEARQSFERAIDDLCRLYRFRPELVACDLHPDYASTLWARQSGLPVAGIQHHQAHLAACAAENDVSPPYLGVAWDGTGYGLDGTVWGGEFFLVENGRFERIAHLRPFRLPGGEAAIRECWRAAAGIQFELGLPVGGSPLVRQMLEKKIHSPLTTSVGRLFDAVASLAGVAQENRFEGQAAMELERAIGGRRSEEAYPLPEGDWGPLIEALLADVSRGAPHDLISARFHNALAGWIVAMAHRAGVRQIIMSGGVFQNRYLVERAAERLESSGFAVYTHQRIPTNDGGIGLGQAVLAGG